MKLVKDLQNGGNLFVVLGDVGSGKTSLTTGHKGKKVVISFDGSYSSLDGHDDITVYEPELSDYADPNAFVKWLDENTKGADLLVFDNISALENAVTEGITDGKLGNNTDGRFAYGYIQKLLNKVSMWAIHYPGDVLFTLWSQHQQDATGKSSEEPAMNAKAFNMVAGYAKLVSRTITGFGGYEVVVNPDGKGVIKNRLSDKIKGKTVKNSDYWRAVEYATKRTD